MTFLRTLGLAVVVTLAACDTAGDSPPASDETVAVAARAGLLLQADGPLGDRLVPVPANVATFYPVAGASARAGAVALSALYNIVPPSAASHATHLTFQDGGVAASYLVPGNAFGGGFDIIDRADPSASTQFTSALVDFAEVFDLGGTLYFSGSLDIENPAAAPLGFASKAVFSSLVPDADGLDSTLYLADLDSDFVMDATYPGSGKHIYVVTGFDGSLYRIDKDNLNASRRLSAFDLRSVAAARVGNKDQLFVLDGAGAVYRMEASKKALGAPIHTATQGGYPVGAIARLHVDGDRVYVPSGVLGFDVITTDGAFVAHVRSGAVKSLATAGDLVFVSNADDGVYVAQWDEAGTALSIIGQIDFGTASVNHIEVDGSTLYVAAGADGLYAIAFSETGE